MGVGEYLYYPQDHKAAVRGVAGNDHFLIGISGFMQRGWEYHALPKVEP